LRDSLSFGKEFIALNGFFFFFSLQELQEAKTAVLKKWCNVPKRADLLYQKVLRDTVIFSTGCKL